MPLRKLGLGDDALKEVTRIPLRQGIQLEVTKNAIVVDHDDETESTVSQQAHC